MTSRIKLGVVGVGRGVTVAHTAGAQGLDVVAICDTRQEELRRTCARLGASAYTSYDEFLEHDLEAVLLANYFHQHAPLAIRALESGRHVMSETSACFTLAEGVQLVRTVERSGRIYMLAENYPYMVFNQETRRLFQAGEIGDFLYGEGEYVHPMSAEYLNEITDHEDHWRNWLPATYYCTHSLAPVMCITDTRPVSVSGFVIAHDPDDAQKAQTAARADTASMIALRMDNGAVVKLLQYGLRGEGNWVRIHGNRGLLENARHGDRNRVRLRKEPFDTPDGVLVDELYLPRFPHHHEEALGAGHGGSDFFTVREFAAAIRGRRQPYLDVYRAVAMSIVGPLAYRSALAGGAPLEVPDFRREEDRRAYENDDWSPDPAVAGPRQPLPSVLGAVEPPAAGIESARRAWAGRAALDRVRMRK
jgi:predicted dehydrogenase